MGPVSPELPWPVPPGQLARSALFHGNEGDDGELGDDRCEGHVMALAPGDLARAALPGARVEYPSSTPLA